MTEDGHKETIQAGDTQNALVYEIEDMEKAISGISDEMHLDYTKDVIYVRLFYYFFVFFSFYC